MTRRPGGGEEAVGWRGGVTVMGEGEGGNNGLFTFWPRIICPSSLGLISWQHLLAFLCIQPPPTTLSFVW